MEKLYKIIDEEAIKDRRKQLKEKKTKGEDLGSLFQVEIALEDNISTRGMKTEVGSKMLEGYIPPFDAEVVTRLKDADALIKGKIDTSEFGIEKKIDSTMGQVINEGEAHASIGIDTNGEIRGLAACSDLYGLKPTYGSISRYGLIGSAPSMEQVGIIAEDIATVQNIFNTIAGKDKKDSTSLEIVKSKVKDVKDIKIGILKEQIESQDDNIKRKIEKNLQKIRDLGVEIEYVSIPSVKYVNSIYNILQSAEFSSDMGKYDGLVFGYNEGQYSDNEDFFRKNRTASFSEKVKKRIMFGNFVLREENYKEYYEKSQRIRTLMAEEVREAFKSYDLILNTIMARSMEATLLANLVGAPALSLPTIEGEEFNLQIMGKKFSEETLFEFAKTYEDKILNRVEKEEK